MSECALLLQLQKSCGSRSATSSKSCTPTASMCIHGTTAIANLIGLNPKLVDVPLHVCDRLSYSHLSLDAENPVTFRAQKHVVYLQHAHTVQKHVEGNHTVSTTQKLLSFTSEGSTAKWDLRGCVHCGMRLSAMGRQQMVWITSAGKPLNCGIQGHLNPPCTGHPGRAGERLIICIRRIMLLLIKRETFEEEILIAVFNMVKGTLNSHPLVSVPLATSQI